MGLPHPTNWATIVVATEKAIPSMNSAKISWTPAFRHALVKMPRRSAFHTAKQKKGTMIRALFKYILKTGVLLLKGVPKGTCKVSLFVRNDHLELGRF
jgi:hypothetical protein